MYERAGPGWYGGPSVGSVSVNRQGCQGQPMHAPGYAFPSYYSNDWYGHAQKLNYTWQLRDVRHGHGGFCIIPGSHKMLHPLPRPDEHAIDLPSVKHLEYDAGDVVIYLGGSLLHGVISWQAKHERRAVLAKAFPMMHPQARL